MALTLTTPALKKYPALEGGQATTQEPPGTAILKMVGVWSPGTAPHKGAGVGTRSLLRRVTLREEA